VIRGFVLDIGIREMGPPAFSRSPTSSRGMGRGGYRSVGVDVFRFFRVSAAMPSWITGLGSLPILSRRIDDFIGFCYA
jgi:hypothetical protein